MRATQAAVPAQALQVLQRAMKFYQKVVITYGISIANMQYQVTAARDLQTLRR